MDSKCASGNGCFRTSLNRFAMLCVNPMGAGSVWGWGLVFCLMLMGFQRSDATDLFEVRLPSVSLEGSLSSAVAQLSEMVEKASVDGCYKGCFLAAEEAGERKVRVAMLDVPASVAFQHLARLADCRSVECDGMVLMVPLGLDKYMAFTRSVEVSRSVELAGPVLEFFGSTRGEGAEAMKKRLETAGIRGFSRVNPPLVVASDHFVVRGSYEMVVSLDTLVTLLNRGLKVK